MVDRPVKRCDATTIHVPHLRHGVGVGSYRRVLPTDQALRYWLARRIETEAWAAARSWPGNRQQCEGRVLGFLEVGVRLGFWSKKTADGVAESVRQAVQVRTLRRRLLR